MSDTVLLTGITGFLGGHVALALLEAGYTVRGSLRNPGPNGERAAALRRTLEAAGGDVSRLQTVELDLTRDAGWTEAAAGARFVMHTASPFVTSMPRDPQELIGPAVAGTERALAAARSAGAERVALTSSTVAITAGRGEGRPDRLGAEEWSRPEDGRLNAYGASKVMAERRAWEIAQAPGAPALAVINPGFILGPLLDADPGTSGAVLARLLRGDLPMVPRLILHTVDVRDLARIHVAALSDPQASGARHPAAFSRLSLVDLCRAMARAAPERARRIPKREAPDWLVRALALFDGDIRANVNELGYGPELDAAAGRRLLGRAPIPGETSAGDMARSLLKRGAV
ncbi:NAD-dependent epimerase/dehydratase family protein [uncultured Albimonas sp.]|mgnify:FL=1|uniref:NAD-dependent epimerase/dehydratase family protein n=1 Tax=uncultured Albimonas sp. TaxID=1331701 RepID=UPI0030EC3365